MLLSLTLYLKHLGGNPRCCAGIPRFALPFHPLIIKFEIHVLPREKLKDQNLCRGTTTVDKSCQPKTL